MAAIIKLGFAPVAILFYAVCAVAGAAPLVLRSPDSAIAVKIAVNTSAQDRGPGIFYSVSFHGRPVVLDSKLSLSLREAPVFSAPMTVASPAWRTIDEKYDLPHGKTSSARNHCNEVTVRVQGPPPARVAVDVSFRAYNDGVAFRYAIARQKSLTSIHLLDEGSEFALAGDPDAHILPFRNFTSSHEGVYEHVRVSQINRQAAPLIDLPALFEISRDTWLAITEADLDDYAGMYLAASPEGRGLRAVLSPRPDDPTVKVQTAGSLTSPWRVLMIADDPGRFIESNLVTSLNKPCALQDISWIKPGKTSWHWWNGTIAKGLPGGGGMDTRTMNYYIDFCARNGIEYHALVGEDDMGWYGPIGGPGIENLDVTKAIPGIDLEQVLKHAKEKGVLLRVWLHWRPIRDPEKMEQAFAQYEKWGITGFMMDFMDRDDQEMVRFINRVIERAAAHHLTVNLHGAYKPTGRERTYPNLLTVEGALNLEYLKWSTLCDPPLHVMHAFTRMLAGPIDYHLGGFHSVERRLFLPQMKEPRVLGTRAHHLALYVVFENPLPMVSDYPEAYEGKPGFDFIRQVPVRWDETRVVTGAVGQYVAIARRHGADWYIGTITDWTSRELRIPLSFLGSGNYTAEIYSDSPGSPEDPSRIVIETRPVTSSTVLTADLESGGGQAVRIRAVTEPRP